MKQILQNLSNGKTLLEEIPSPDCRSTEVQIRTLSTLISLGTERMLVDFGRGNLFQKVQQQPEKVQMVLEKAATDGIAATYDAVKSKLDQPLPLGYCQTGVVLDGNDSEFKPGDRVVSNGNHAEVVCVSRNLVARIPDDVSFAEAAFTPVAAIGLQGMRLIVPQIGETIVVIGLGLIGLLTVQMLRAQGCRVIGTDFDADKLALAESYGAKTINLSEVSDPVATVLGMTGHIGADAVIITASTKSDDPASQAARMSRKRGKIVLVGVVGLKLNRADFYEKELTFQVSCSYGAGRYDPSYEEDAVDYPVGYVRWTEKRNFEAVLQLLESGSLDVKKLISGRYPIDQATVAYERVATDNKALGLILDYPQTTDVDQLLSKSVVLDVNTGADHRSGNAIVAVVGAGNYASRVLIPAIKTSGANLHTVISRGGVTAAHHGKSNGFSIASSDASDVMRNEAVNTVVIATRHNSHAEFVVQAIDAGKHVFVEKPLALTMSQLEAIRLALGRQTDSKSTNKQTALMVGFNRRFAPHSQKLKSLLSSVNEPISVIMTMNAGSIPADSWVQSKEEGGGRIIGEACHYVDLMRFFVGSPIVSVNARRMGENNYCEITEDKAIITLGFADGSIGVINYLANGGKRFPKERIEVFAEDAVLQLDNFRRLTGFGWPGFKKLNLMRQDKGQEACMKAFVSHITDAGPIPIPVDELLEVSEVSILCGEQLRQQDV